MAQQQSSRQTKMAMASQFLGFMLDAYDMALVLVMAPILVRVFVSPKGSAAWCACFRHVVKPGSQRFRFCYIVAGVYSP
jgi:hypothetical protein